MALSTNVYTPPRNVERIPEEKLLESLENLNVIKNNDHFILKSGLHTNQYINKDKLYSRPDYTSYLCYQIASHILENIKETIYTVVAPAVGGIPMSQWLSYHLQELQGSTVLATYTEKDNSSLLAVKPQKLGREYQANIRFHNVVVADDVLTTGSSMKQVIDTVNETNGKIVGSTSIFNRGGITKEALEIPYLYSLFNFQLETYESEECPMCASGIPINEQLGHYKGKA